MTLLKDYGSYLPDNWQALAASVSRQSAGEASKKRVGAGRDAFGGPSKKAKGSARAAEGEEEDEDEEDGGWATVEEVEAEAAEQQSQKEEEEEQEEDTSDDDGVDFDPSEKRYCMNDGVPFEVKILEVRE